MRQYRDLFAEAFADGRRVRKIDIGKRHCEIEMMRDKRKENHNCPFKSCRREAESKQIPLALVLS